MGKIAIPFFAASFVFLVIAIVTFVRKDVSLAMFLLFYMFGFGSGCFLVGHMHTGILHGQSIKQFD